MDDPRIDLRQLDAVNGGERIASAFERLLPDLIELEQVGHTRRQFTDGIPVHLSRIGRVYIRCAPQELDELFVQAKVIGDVLRASNPSDHIPVSASLARRTARHPLLRVPLLLSLCRSEHFAVTARSLLAQLPPGLGAFEALECVKDSFRIAAMDAAKALAAAQFPGEEMERERAGRSTRTRISRLSSIVSPAGFSTSAGYSTMPGIWC